MRPKGITVFTSEKLRRIRIETTYRRQGDPLLWKPDDNVRLHFLTEDEPWEGPNKRVIPKDVGDERVVRVIIDSEVGPGRDEDQYLRDGKFVADEHFKEHFCGKGKEITVLDS